MSQANLPEIELRNVLENTISLPKTFKQTLVTSTAQTLGQLGVDITQSNFAGIRITVEALDIRTIDDGTTPLAGTGELRKPGSYFFSRGEAKSLQLIAVGADVTCQFQPQTFSS